MPGSVRARTTIAATVVVAIALIAVGIVVIALLRDRLVGDAELAAKLNAQSVASQIASGVPLADLDLPDSDEPTQVVDEGAVVAADDDFSSIPIADFSVEQLDDVDRDEDDDDDDDDDDLQWGAVSDEVTVETVTVGGAFHRVVGVSARTPAGKVLTIYAGVSLSTEEEAVDAVGTSMLIALPVLLLVVGGVTWAVTRRALQPVAAIRTQMAEITAGDLAMRVPVPSTRDEIHDLAITTNKTLAALEDAVGRQRQFIADASHELRSPLAILRAQLEVATAHPQLFDMEATLNDVIRLQRLATDLLMLARMDAGERAVGNHVDVGDLVQEEAARRVRTGRVPIEVFVADDIRVTGVHSQLARVISNLVDNAQRHAASVVAVTARPTDDDCVSIEVDDDGPGVPVTDRERVFERFVRLDESRSRDEGGAGLGLAIVRDVVVAHGGTITVGDSPRGGAVFRVLLPRNES